MININELVKPGGSVFIIIGDNLTYSGSKRIVVKTTKVLTETGLGLGWRLKDKIPIHITTDKLKHQSNAITENTILWFEK